jgi:transcriptional regulator with XRE-family HTH domain
MNDLLELKAQMVRHRIRQRQVAGLLNIGESRLSDILNGLRPIDSDLRRRIRQAIEDLVAERESRL